VTELANGGEGGEAAADDEPTVPPRTIDDDGDATERERNSGLEDA